MDRTVPFDYHEADGVATLTFSRPERLNALTFEVYEELGLKLRELRGNRHVGALIIAGRGRGFCSGGDVDEIIGQLFQRDMRAVLEFTRLTGQVVENLRRLDIPVVAAVNGMAAGAGAVIALGCDFRVLSSNARFAFLFTQVGLSGADMGACHLLPKLVGLARATELLMLGDTIDAETALHFGLANKVVPPTELEAETQALAQRLARGPRLALSMTKELLNNEGAMDLHAAIEAEAQAQALLLMGKDHREFYEAYKAKRAPAWTGR